MRTVCKPKELDDFAALIGLDWADRKHDITLEDVSTGNVERMVVKQSPNELLEWITNLRNRYKGRKVAICLEQSRGAVINALMCHDFFVIYPVNPLTVSKIRKAFATSGAKDDPTDADLILDILKKHHNKLRVWHPDDALTREIRVLVEARRNIVDLRTRYSNQLTAVLKQYYPQALQLAGTNLYSEMACEFLTKWPTFEDLKRTKPEDIEKFYSAHNSRSKTLMKARLNIIKKTPPLTTDGSILSVSMLSAEMLIKQLKQLRLSQIRYENAIDCKFEKHPDARIFKSFPGAGNVFAARVLAAFGSDRNRYDSADAVQTFSGIAPIKVKSGKSSVVRRRYACPKFVKQSFHEFAGCSLKYSLWAKAYYDMLRHQGKGHHACVRALAFKWIRIIYRCWKENEIYSEIKYIKSLQRRRSPLLRYLVLEESNGSKQAAHLVAG